MSSSFRATLRLPRLSDRATNPLSTAFASVGSRSASYACLLEAQPEPRFARLHEPPLLSWSTLLTQKTPKPVVVASMLFTRIAQTVPPSQKIKKPATLLYLPSVCNEVVDYLSTTFARPQPFSPDLLETLTQTHPPDTRHASATTSVVGVEANGYLVNRDAEGTISSLAVLQLQTNIERDLAALVEESRSRIFAGNLQVITPARCVFVLSPYLSQARHDNSLLWVWFDFDVVRTYLWEGGALTAIHSFPNLGLISFVETLSKKLFPQLDDVFWHDQTYRPKGAAASLSECVATSFAQWIEQSVPNLIPKEHNGPLVFVAPSVFWERVGTMAMSRISENTLYTPRRLLAASPATHHLRHTYTPLFQEPPLALIAQLSTTSLLYAA
ncbi:MAG: hypothetical protein KatS3mg100_426 [Candidatus Parcubacteria bacterium]|nr:MAG: hypothetical protein KatS3mg100_426 [Candidatus Parcubacteria bacterium]